MRHIMSLLATAAANTNLPGNCCNDDSNKAAMPSNSPTSKGLNQMEDTEDNEELGKHLNNFVQQDKDKGEGPTDGEISFGPGHTSFWPPLFSRMLVARIFKHPTYNISSGPQSESCFHCPQLMPQTPCLMPSMNLSQRCKKPTGDF